MKSKIIGRKQVVAFILSLTLCLAVYVNWYYTKAENEVKNEPEITEDVNLGDAQFVNSDNVSEDYFETARINRTKAHDSAKEMLQAIIDSNADEDTKASAREKLTYLSETIKIEADCENLIAAQISDNCVVTIDTESAEIIVPSGRLDENLIIKIKDIILSKTKIIAENITIVEL